MQRIFWAPVASSFSLAIFEDQAVLVTLMGTDSDTEDSLLQFQIIDYPQSGSLTPLSKTEYKYNPASNYEGNDGISYFVSYLDHGQS